MVPFRGSSSGSQTSLARVYPLRAGAGLTAACLSLTHSTAVVLPATILSAPSVDQLRTVGTISALALERLDPLLRGLRAT